MVESIRTIISRLEKADLLREDIRHYLSHIR